jgi:hypothetical protein
LFLVANRELGSRSHQNDFQRALESAVDHSGLFANAGSRGSGEYHFTPHGRSVAERRHPSITPMFRPQPKRIFRCSLATSVSGIAILVETRSGRSTVLIDGKPMKSAKEACRIVAAHTGRQLSTVGDSAVRVLQDFMLDCGVTITLGSN